MYDEYAGNVTPSGVAQRNVAALGDGAAALLGNHGVLVVAPTMPIAHLRCVALEWRCRFAWRIKALGESAGEPMTKEAADAMAATVHGERRHWPYYYEAAVRREIRRDPSVLD